MEAAGHDILSFPKGMDYLFSRIGRRAYCGKPPE